MKNLLLHSKTRDQLMAYVQHPAQALLLTGPAGSGKSTLAAHSVAEVLGITAQSVYTHPYIRHIKNDGKPIGIESIRDLEQFLALKVPGDRTPNRAIIIEDSHNLTLEAQNALLKTLEEPPKGTVLVLTADTVSSLLPTIRSRAQIIQVQMPLGSDVKQFFVGQDYPLKKVEPIYAVAAGLPGLMSALLDDNDHPLLAAAEQAKKILQSSVYERLLAVDELAKQRPLAEQTLKMLQQMAHLSLQNAQGQAAKRWQTILKAAYEAHEALQKNAQPKLVLTHLFLQF